MGETKKVRSTGRFGSRYGVGIRKKILKIEPMQVERQKCPNCGFSGLKRKSKGIFACKKCSHEFVGGAYLPKTPTGGLISQMVSQKKFVPEAAEELAKASGKDSEAEKAVEKEPEEPSSGEKEEAEK